MPKIDDVGFSDTTPAKMERLRGIFAMHLAITQAVLEKNPRFSRKYHYLDMTSGKGSYPDGTEGSPIVFLENSRAEKFRIPFRADFIEQNHKNLKELESSVEVRGWTGDNLHFHAGDYRRIVRAIYSSVIENELGLAFIDPSGDLPDFDTLRFIAEMRPRMEILIYISSTNVKRVEQYTKKILADYLSKIPKSNWLISTPLATDKFKWIFLLASNSDVFKDYKKIGFYRLDSKYGEELFAKVNLTEKQRNEILQPRLPSLD